MRNRVVIIGAGPAGVSVAETVRAYDRQVELIVVSAEPYPPYSPPAMVDHFLTGSQSHLWRGGDWPERWQVDYRKGVMVAAIEPADYRLSLDSGAMLGYDKLVIATGSRLYAPLEGSENAGVYNFKSLQAAEALVERVKSGEARRAVIVGAGFIGMEIALLLSELGVTVIQVEMLDQVMPAMLDKETADFTLSVMRQRGIDVRLNTKALAFTGEKRVTGVKLETGETLEADILIAATGVRPNLEALQASGIAYRWGITVDDHLRTSAPDVYAAGDAVEAMDRLTGEVYVHANFPNAVEQGCVVGLNLLGFDVSYAGAERMNSLKHLGLPVMAVGLKQGDEVLQDRRDGVMRTLYMKEDRLVGFQLVGQIHAAGVLRTLMNTHRNLREIKDRLLDPNFGEGSLVWGSLTPDAV
jgi:nitrite reductase (NADH) large subunit